MLSTERFIQDCLRIRSLSPLVHNITNYVAMNPAANALLALGASPLMSFYPGEMEEISLISDALTVNIGCLDTQQMEAMRMAAASASKYGKPWILDPVGVGASRVRRDICKELIGLRPAVIRGNASEIACLASVCIPPSHSVSGSRPASSQSCTGPLSSRGVDSTMSSDDVVEAAKSLAKASGAVVSMSGATDYITDGQRVECIRNGDSIMSRVTVMGCIATAVTGAFAAVNDDMLSAALHAMAFCGVAGEKAAGRSAGGTGTFAVKYMDALSTFDPCSDSVLIRQ